MKFQCLINNLKEGIIHAERLVSKSQSLPVLNGIYLGTEKDKIKIRATNLETALEIDFSGKIIEPGSLVVPAKILSSFLSNTSEEQITIESQRNNLCVKTKNTEVLLHGYNPEDFPIFPKFDSENSFTINSLEFRDSVISVLPAASQFDIKPELNSIFFRLFKNTLKIAATDSFRLAERVINNKYLHSDKLVSFLVPSRAIAELLKLMTQDEDIKISVSKNQVTVTSTNYKFISRLTEGLFPEYEQVVPKKFEVTAVVKKSDFTKHLKLAGVFVNKSSEVVFEFLPSKKQIKIFTSQPDIGEYKSAVDASIQGQELNLKFNWKYVWDGISQINNEYILLNTNSSQSPLLICGKGDTSYSYLVMPMRGI